MGRSASVQRRYHGEHEGVYKRRMGETRHATGWGDMIVVVRTMSISHMVAMLHSLTAIST